MSVFTTITVDGTTLIERCVCGAQANIGNVGGERGMQLLLHDEFVRAHAKCGADEGRAVLGASAPLSSRQVSDRLARQA